MSNPPRPDPSADTEKTPRWVKVFGVILLVVIVLVILRLTGVIGRHHGPGRHMPMGNEASLPTSGLARL